jgi:hypothetical protein
MADTKISALTGATTPLAGTEVLPIVQSGTTVKVSVDNLTTGKLVSMDKLLVGTGDSSAGVNLRKSTAAWNTSGNTYPFPAGNIFGAIGNAVSAQENWFGFIGDYGTSSGSVNILLQQNLNNTNQQAGNFIGSEATSAAAADVIMGKMVAASTAGGNSTKTVQARLKSGGDFEIAAGNLVIGTSGNGIDFSATSGAGTSELLADYEEGTWTPVLSSASGSFTTVTLGADTSAYYTKIGREVTFQMWFTTDAITVGTASGDVYISLPFTAATLAGAGDHSSASVSLSLNFTINHPDSALVRGGDNKMNLITRTTANGATSNLQVGSLATGAGSNIIVISGLYIAA